MQMSRGDGFAYYSPREGMKQGEPVKAFTAIGVVIDDAPYLAEQSETFRPYRRRVDYLDAKDASLASLLDRISFVDRGQNPGLALRRGFFEIQGADYVAIAEAMGVAGA